MDAPIRGSGLVELVGVNDQVDQNDFGASVAVTTVPLIQVSGEIVQWGLFSTVDGTGSVQTPAGTLFVFSANPAIAAGDTSITAAERLTVIGQIGVAASDWKADANGASAFIHDQPLVFPPLGTLYLAWFHEDATSFNDGAGDDEQLEGAFWYRRDS